MHSLCSGYVRVFKRVDTQTRPGYKHNLRSRAAFRNYSIMNLIATDFITIIHSRAQPHCKGEFDSCANESSSFAFKEKEKEITG